MGLAWKLSLVVVVVDRWLEGRIVHADVARFLFRLVDLMDQIQLGADIRFLVSELSVFDLSSRIVKHSQVGSLVVLDDVELEAHRNEVKDVPCELGGNQEDQSSDEHVHGRGLGDGDHAPGQALIKPHVLFGQLKYQQCEVREGEEGEADNEPPQLFQPHL